MNDANNERKAFFDIVKGVTIILVVFGHCIQCGNGELFYTQEQYYYNPVFRLICSFHMPILMIISGFFFYRTNTKYDGKTILLRKIEGLVVPAVVWKVLNCTVGSFVRGYSFRKLIVSLIIGIAAGYWYVQAIVVCSFIAFFVSRKLKDSMAAYGLILLAGLFLPELLNIRMFVFMYPFFMVGYFLNKTDLPARLSKLPLRSVLLVCGVLLAAWFLLFLFYQYDSFIYTTGVRIIKGSLRESARQLLVDCYRWIIGFAGSAAVLTLIQLLTPVLERCRTLISLGKHSLLIYLFGGIITGEILLPLTHTNHYSLAINLIETVLILIVCEITYRIIRKSTLASRLLIGIR